MPDPNEERILITVDIVSNNQRLIELQKQLLENRTALAALNQAAKEGRLTNDELAAGQVRLADKTKQITQEVGILTKANAQQTLANKASSGSIEQLRAQLSLGTVAYNKLSQEERDNTVAGQKLQATNKAVSDQLKVLEKAVGDARRSVGDYNTGIKDVNVVSGQLTGGLKTVTDTALKPFQQTLDRGTGLFTKFKSGSDLVKTGLTALKPAGEEGAGGFKAVAAGIALTGLGVFLLLLGSVISYFTQTNEGGKILKQGLAALGAVVTTVANGITGAGKGLVQAFKDPKVALQDLLGFLKDQVVNRLAAFGLLIDGIRNRDFKKITDSVIQFNLGITNGTDKISAYAYGIGKAATNAATLEQQFQALKKRRAEQEIDEVKEKGRVDELLLLSKDRTLSAAERLTKLREAGRIENELSKKSLDLITEEKNALLQRNKAKGLSTTADEIQEERDKRKEFNASVAERNNSLATIKARQSRFILEERAELAKDQKERASLAQTAKETAIKAKQEEVLGQLLAVQRGTAAELVLLQRQIDLKAELEAAGEKKTAQEKRNLVAAAELEKQKLQADFDQKHAQATKTEQKREYDESLVLLEQYLDTKRLELEKELTSGVINEKTYQQRILQQEQTGLAAKLVLAKEYKQDATAIEKQITAGQLAELHKRTEAQNLENQKQLATAEAFGSALGAIVSATLNDTGASLQDFASKVLILILDSLEKAALAAAAQAVFINAPKGFVGIVEGAAAAAVITAAFETVKAGLAQPAKKQFHDGGLLQGPSHAAGGIPFSVGGRLGFEAEGGEILMNQKSSAALAPVLSYLNASYGGANFAPGFSPARPTAPRSYDGGLAARQAGRLAAIDPAQLVAALERAQLTTNFDFSAHDRGRVKYDSPRRNSTLGD